MPHRFREAVASSSSCWICPPPQLLDMLMAEELSPRDRVAMQLINKFWHDEARQCLKRCVPRRPDTSMSSLVHLYPNLTQLDLSRLDALSVAALLPLTGLTALRDLSLTDVHQAYTGIAEGSSPLLTETPNHSQPGLPNQQLSGSQAEAGNPETAGPAATLQVPLTERGADLAPEGEFSNPSPSLTHHLQGTATGNQATAPEADAQQQLEPIAPAPASAPSSQPLLDIPAVAGVQGPTSAAQGGILSDVGGHRVVLNLSAWRAATAASAGLKFVRLLSGLTRLHAHMCPSITPQVLSQLTNLSELSLDCLANVSCLTHLTHLTHLTIQRLPSLDPQCSSLTTLCHLSITTEWLDLQELLTATCNLPLLTHLVLRTSSTNRSNSSSTPMAGGVRSTPFNWATLTRLRRLELRASPDALKLECRLLRQLSELEHLSIELSLGASACGLLAGSADEEEEDNPLVVVVPGGLKQLTLVSDKSSMEGSMQVHLPMNCSIHTLSLRLYWSHLELVPVNEHGARMNLFPPHEDEDACNSLNQGASWPSTHLQAHRADGVGADVQGEALHGPLQGWPQQPGAQPVQPALCAGDPANQPPTGLVRAATLPTHPIDIAGLIHGHQGGLPSTADTTLTSSHQPLWVVQPDRRMADTGSPSRLSSDTTSTDTAPAQQQSAPASLGQPPVLTLGGPSVTSVANTVRVVVRTAGKAAAAAAAGGTGMTDGDERSEASQRALAGVDTDTGADEGGSGRGPMSEWCPHLSSLALEACFRIVPLCTDHVQSSRGPRGPWSLLPSHLCRDSEMRRGLCVTSVTLDAGLSVDDHDMWALTALKSLMRLSVSGCQFVTDMGLSAAGRLPRLTHFEVAGMCDPGNPALQSYVRCQEVVRAGADEVEGRFIETLRDCKRLKHLGLIQMHNLKEVWLARGLSRLKHISSLEIHNCDMITDKMMSKVATCLTGLTHLSVTHCLGVTDVGRTAVLSALGPCLALDLEGCSIKDVTRPGFHGAAASSAHADATGEITPAMRSPSPEIESGRQI